MLTCKDCLIGVMPVVGGPCEMCTLPAIGDSKLCHACSLISCECNRCRADVARPADQSLRDEVKRLQRYMKSSLADFQKQYESLVEPIAADIETLESSLKAIAEKEKQSWANHFTVRNDGGFGSAVIKSKQDQAAFDAERNELQQARDLANGIFTPHKPLFDFATKWKKSEDQRCIRRFNAQVKHIIAVENARRLLKQENMHIDALYMRELPLSTEID